MEPNLITLRTFSLSFQHIFAENRIPRSNLVNEIDDMFDKDCKIIILEGKEGCGKTDILLQFSRKHCFDSVTFFINPAFRASYRQDYLMEDIGRQIYFYNKNEAPPDELEITEGIFNKLAFDLITSPGRKNKPVYFLLDGLDQIEKSDFELLKNTLQNLPWSTNNFYFIVTGTIEKLKDLLPSPWLKNFKSLRVPRFTEYETIQLFNLDESIESKSFLHEVHNTWKGHPESLSQVKRILDSGITIQEFLEKFDISEKNELLEVEWKRANLDSLDINSNKTLVIAILTFDDNIRSIDRIASILNISKYDLVKLISEISFLAINDENISFVSSSYRQYALYKLKRFEKGTNAKLIEFYTQTDDINSILNLPTLFDKNNEWNSIVNLLTIDNLDLIISNSKSFSDIKKQLNYGYKAAKSLKNSYENIFRFSLHRSILIGLQTSDNRKHKIRACVALDHQEDVFNLIANSVLKEDKLKMLIFFAQYSKIEKKEVDGLIINEIKDLLEEVDPGYLRENMMDIAIGLAYFLPNEAIQVIEKALGLKPDNNSIEWLMGVIAMIVNKNREISGEDDLSPEKEHVSKNTFVDKFAKSIGYGISEVKSVEILAEIEKVEKASDRIFLMRKWIKGNPKSENIYEVINYTLNLLTQESSTAKPSTETLYDIVFPIRFFDDKEVIDTMKKRIEDLMITVFSPTIGNVRLQIVIIEALLNIDIDEANNRMINLSAFINVQTDVCIKLEAYANLWKMFKEISKANKFDLDHILLDEKYLKGEIESLLCVFLETIADQHDEIVETLVILSKLDFSYALYIAGKLNTAYRRDKAIQTCIESYTSKDFNTWLLDDIEYAVNLIKSPTIRTETITLIFEAAFEQRDVARHHKFLIKDLLPLINTVKGNTNRCELISLSIILLGLKQTNKPQFLPRYDDLIIKLNSFLKKFYNKIDDPLEKIKMGYRLVSLLGNHNKQLAEEYFLLAESSSKEMAFEEPIQVYLLLESIRMMIRIYSGLIRKRDFSYEKISYLINYLPSKEDQITLWSELAVRVSIAGKSALTNDIVNQKIIPAVENYKKNKEKADFVGLLKRAASAIHVAQPATLLLFIKDLDVEERESILPNIFIVLLSNCHESDPFDNLQGSVHFSYQNAIDYINLLGYLDTDAIFYQYLRNFTKIVKLNPNIFTRIQKGELFQKLEELTVKKMPNKESGIQHDGYLISALACLQNLSIGAQEKTNQKFSELDARVLLIKSTADRAVVYLNLAIECENKKKKSEFLKKAFAEVDQIPSVTERTSMYESALELCAKISVDLFNNYLRVYEQDIYNLDENEQYPTFKRLIDLAYRCDKNIAQRIISNLDTDPAKKKMSEPAANHFEKLDLERSAQSDYGQIGKIKEREEKSNFAWRLLAQLNSDKRKARDINETIVFLHSASTLPFFYSVPLYEFFIENIIKGDDKENLLLSFYESANANAKLCYNLICNIADKNASTLSYNINTSNNSIVVYPGMHKEAVDFIRNFASGTESKEIYIVDPYFSESDMHFLKNIDQWCYNSSTIVLTSCEASGEFSRTNYIRAWDDHSYEVPPSNTFVRAKNQNSKSPFHDRYILLYDKKMGLRLGASINGIYGQKTFEISKMLSTEVENIYETIVRPLVYQRVKDYLDQVVKYESFDF